MRIVGATRRRPAYSAAWDREITVFLLISSFRSCAQFWPQKCLLCRYWGPLPSLQDWLLDQKGERHTNEPASTPETELVLTRSRGTARKALECHVNPKHVAVGWQDISHTRIIALNWALGKIDWSLLLPNESISNQNVSTICNGDSKRFPLIKGAEFSEYFNGN